MSFKIIVLFALLAVVFAESPHLGFSGPSLRANQFSSRVVGGSEAPKNGSPYIVSLQWSLLNFKPKHFCAGTILNDQWILTAGHCIEGIPKLGNIIIKAGKHNIKQKENTEQDIEVAQTFVHEKYGGDVGPYDIALIKVKKPLELTKEVQPIDLPELESDPTGDSYLCGWGSTSTSMLPSMPSNLQEIVLPIVNRQICYDAVMKLTGSSPVDETNICTGPLDGGKSACNGDSGGPLTTADKKTLIGVVSWGIVPCGKEGAPAVYTRVSKFISWINDKIKDN